MALHVARAAIDRMLSEAAGAAPEECCGILLGEGDKVKDVRPTANVAPAPLRAFEIDAEALIAAHRSARSGGLQVLGYFHSHPAGAAEPSAADRAQAAHDGRVWAIVGEGGVTVWRDDENGFTALSYTVDEG